jgi:hypothetical protein
MWTSFTLWQWLPTADNDSDKRQTRPLVREGAPQKQDCNCQTIINIWSWAPDGVRHQEVLTDCQSQCDFDFDFELVESAESYGCGKWKAGSRGWGQFGNPEEGEHLLLEAAAKQRLVKTEKPFYLL